MRIRAATVACAFALAGSALAGSAHAQGGAPGSERCSPVALGSAAAAMGVEIESAVGRAEITDARGRTAPAHCEMFASLEPRTGRDGQAYKIRFHLRLPVAWNQGFYFQGGGGSDGVVGDALGDLRQGPGYKNALQLGYAVVSQDSGHDNAVNIDPARGGVLAFGWDPQARENYAYRAIGRVTQVAKALTASYYGQPLRRSYFVGCSKGGQEGLAAAQHYPDAFDGIIANAPGFALPKAAVAEAWDTQALARAAVALGKVDAQGLPRLGDVFSDADMNLAAGAVLRACDALDGLKDGMVLDYQRCTTARVAPALSALQCKGAKTDTCLAAPQITALRTIYAGARDGRGRALYSDWAWDAGLASTDWRGWKMGSGGAAANNARNVLLGLPSLGAVFSTRPFAVAPDAAAAMRFGLAYDFDRDAPRIFAADGLIPSPWEMFNAQSMLEAFKSHGGRAIILQGLSDPVFSVKDTARWWDRVNARHGGRAADFVRLYPVAGMNHCGGGPATTNYDAFGALVAWVEQGVAPTRILATAPAGTPWPGRTRPLCPYPSVAVHDGKGDPESAASFSCRAAPARSKAGSRAPRAA